MQTPKLRSDIDVIPVQVDGKRVYAVTDTLGLIKNPVGVTQELLDMMILLDGRRNLAEIQAELASLRRGVFVSIDEVTSIIRELDSAMILENGTYRNARSEIIRSFVESPSREASLSEKAYPGEKGALQRYLAGIMGNCNENGKTPGDNLFGLVAPHIDLRVGKEGYRQAYRQLAGLEPDTVIILGTGHRVGTGLFSLTKKDFETPLGLLRTDKAAVDSLFIAGAGLVTENDFDHKDEHSIEFQTLFLKYLLGERAFNIVPILCGDITRYPGRYSSFAEVPGVALFCDTLRDIAKGGRCLIVAGVDLSHIGPKFGDSLTSEALKNEAEEYDRSLVRAVSENNRSGYWAVLRECNDKYHVCGASSLAVLLEIMPESTGGDTLYYRMWHEKSTRSAVSFCSVAFRGVKKGKPGKTNKNITIDSH